MYDLINFNGTQIQDTHLERLAFNRSFLYGDGFFETMRVINGSIPLWEYHWNRISKSLDYLKFPSHSIMEKEALKSELLNSIGFNKNATCKIIIFRTGPGKYAPKMPRLQYMISCQSFSTPLPIWPENGLKVAYCQNSIVPAEAPYGFLKKTAALPYVIADQEKVELGLDELIILNTKGEVAESIYHNVFCIIKGEVITSPISSGCVEGVFRNFLLDHLQVAGQKTIVRTLTQEDLSTAEEIFLTNAVRLIQPVSELNGKKYNIKRSLQIFEEITKRFSNRT